MAVLGEKILKLLCDGQMSGKLDSHSFHVEASCSNVTLYSPSLPFEDQCAAHWSYAEKLQ